MKIQKVKMQTQNHKKLIIRGPEVFIDADTAHIAPALY